MSDYRNSDYALNKFSEGIVYRFSGEIRIVTMEDRYIKGGGSAMCKDCGDKIVFGRETDTKTEKSFYQAFL